VEALLVGETLVPQWAATLALGEQQGSMQAMALEVLAMMVTVAKLGQGVGLDEDLTRDVMEALPSMLALEILKALHA